MKLLWIVFITAGIDEELGFLIQILFRNAHFDHFRQDFSTNFLQLDVLVVLAANDHSVHTDRPALPANRRPVLTRDLNIGLQFSTPKPGLLQSHLIASDFNRMKKANSA